MSVFIRALQSGNPFGWAYKYCYRNYIIFNNRFQGVYFARIEKNFTRGIIICKQSVNLFDLLPQPMQQVPFFRLLVRGLYTSIIKLGVENVVYQKGVRICH